MPTPEELAAAKAAADQAALDAAADSTDDDKSGAGSTDAQQANTDLKSKLTDAQKSAEEWKSRFTGIQGTYQREQKKWTDSKEKVTDLEGQISALSAERDTLSGQVEELTPVKVQVVELQAKYDRQKLIASEFPDLLKFESDGLLPIDTDAEVLKPKLESFREHIKVTNESALKDELEGGVPPKPKGDPPEGPKETYASAMKAYAENDMKEYNRLMDQYYTTQNKANKEN